MQTEVLVFFSGTGRCNIACRCKRNCGFLVWQPQVNLDIGGFVNLQILQSRDSLPASQSHVTCETLMSDIPGSQGVVRVLQNRQKANKGVGELKGLMQNDANISKVCDWEMNVFELV